MDKKISVFLRTFGCQMNIRDSEVISGLLIREGFRIADDPAQADIVLFNTCSVRQHAEDKVWSEAGRVSGFPKRPVIGIVGCMAQNYKEKIFERSPSVDFAVGPSDIHKIPRIIQSLSAGSPFERKIWETDGEIRPEQIYHTGFYEDKAHAYVVISEGCSNFCSYCVVPYVRGALRNRSYKDILKEIEGAISAGITSITLLGQNVNSYRDGDMDFSGLIGRVNLIKGLKEFSFITSHPRDTGRALFEAMAKAEKLKKYLHLPAQSGSDRVLGMMNRGYNRNFYLDLADNYRRIVKRGALTTDIIVGFPTETEEDFQDTRGLVLEVEFDSAYIFKYSPRPHTGAASLPDDVKREEKERRHKVILDIQKDISRKKKCLKL
ncbi:MAG: tRNA (N6-isopentenyl adenosine(37)-C2)-methylthiotransferase MiaB [Candidatus Omnitrophota bacterium]|jgi:tRNA-2-methylthio-N6-dimethylallyladenosine synthase